MRILHILDHSIPLHSGYTFRTAAILREQRALGWETFHLTSPKQGQTAAEVEDVDGLRFYRSPVPPPGRSGLNELRQIRVCRKDPAHIDLVVFSSAHLTAESFLQRTQ